MPATFSARNKHTAKVGPMTGPFENKSAGGRKLTICTDTHICYIRFSATLGGDQPLVSGEQTCREREANSLSSWTVLGCDAGTRNDD